MKAEIEKTQTALRAAILPIGREILTGRVQDSNSRFLAARLFEKGIRVVRICAVDDDVAAISREFRRCRADGANVIVSTGGLGPTPDDLTLRAVAEVLRRPLVEDKEALAHVERRYNELFEQGKLLVPGLTEDRRKMAWIPKGAKIITNSVGTAPGIEVRWGRVRVFCLPGVPKEMEPMAEQYVLPSLVQAGGLVVRRLTLVFPVCDESSLAGVIRTLQPEHPGVLMKPEPKGYGVQREMRLHLECEGDEETVLRKLDAAAQALRSALQRLGLHEGLSDETVHKVE